jgi:ribonuclease R
VKPQSRALKGRLLFNMRGGGARLLGEGDKLLAWIGEGETGTGLHGDTVEARQTRGDRAQVTRVLERAREVHVGTLQKQKGNAYVIPDDPRMPFNLLVRAGGPELSRPPRTGDKVAVRMEPWTNANLSPAGQIIELLGAAGAPGVDMLSVIRTHELPGDFPAAVMRETQAFADGIPQDELSRREDCRKQLVLTIDPDDAKDHDDAITVEKHGDGWRLSVHIADVAHFVRPGSALDKEARRRGNSTYLADRCIPMLPLRLSADLCSLREGVDRFAHSVFMEITPAGKVKKVRFAKTVIRVTARLTYRQAHAMLEGKKVGDFPPEIAAQVRGAWELAAVLRKQRFAQGSLDLDFPEVKVWLDKEGRAERIERVVHDESHQLVEEFMLAANEAVAHEIKNRPAACIYRIHEKPDKERLQEFRQVAAVAGLRLGDLTQRKEVMRMLQAIRDRPDEFRLKLEFLKSLKRAAYSPEPLGHYGLAKADYLHFTSPIRRYADLVAHRVLAREKGGGRKELGETADHISETERRSAAAEQESVLLKKMEFFQRQLDAKKPQNFTAVVREVKAQGLLVEVPDVDTTGFIQLWMLPGGPYQFDSARARMTNRRSKKSFQAGDKLAVYVYRVDAERRQIDFAPSQD